MMNMIINRNAQIIIPVPFVLLRVVRMLGGKLQDLVADKWGQH